MLNKYRPKTQNISVFLTPWMIFFNAKVKQFKMKTILRIEEEKVLIVKDPLIVTPYVSLADLRDNNLPLPEYLSKNFI